MKDLSDPAQPENGIKTQNLLQLKNVSQEVLPKSGTMLLLKSKMLQVLILQKMQLNPIAKLCQSYVKNVQ